MAGTLLCNTCSSVLGTLLKDEVTQADAHDRALSECDNGHQNVVLRLEDDTLLQPE